MFVWVGLLELINCLRMVTLGGGGGFGNFPCLRNMWAPPKLLLQFFLKEGLGLQIGSSF